VIEPKKEVPPRATSTATRCSWWRDISPRTMANIMTPADTIRTAMRKRWRMAHRKVLSATA